MALSSDFIKQKAHEIGFHKVGITNAVYTKKEHWNLEAWLSQEKHGEMNWMKKRKSERGNIFEYFPEVKTIVSIVKNNKSIITEEMTFENISKAQELSKEMVKKNPKLLKKKP